MVIKWLKIIKRENNKDEILDTIEKIISRKIYGLDIIKIKGKSNFYRCRIGKIRIIYYYKNGKNYIYSVGYRGDIYKGL